VLVFALYIESYKSAFYGQCEVPYQFSGYATAVTRLLTLEGNFFSYRLKNFGRNYKVGADEK